MPSVRESRAAPASLYAKARRAAGLGWRWFGDRPCLADAHYPSSKLKSPLRCRSPRPRSMPIRVRLVDRAASAPSLGGEVRQRPERLPGASDPAAAPAPAAAAPAARYPIPARCRAAVERPRVFRGPSPGPGVGSPARFRRRVRLGCAERVRAHLGASAVRPPSGGWPSARRASSGTGCGKAPSRRRSSGSSSSRSRRQQTGGCWWWSTMAACTAPGQSRSGWRRTKPQQSCMFSRPTRRKSIRWNC